MAVYRKITSTLSGKFQKIRHADRKKKLIIFLSLGIILILGSNVVNSNYSRNLQKNSSTELQQVLDTNTVTNSSPVVGQPHSTTPTNSTTPASTTKSTPKTSTAPAIQKKGINFNLSVSSVSLSAGETSQAITAEAIDGKEIKFSSYTNITGIRVGSSVLPKPTNKWVFNIFTDATTKPGTYQLSISGFQQGPYTDAVSKTLTVTIEPQKKFTLNFNSSHYELDPFETDNINIPFTITHQNGHNERIDLNATVIDGPTPDQIRLHYQLNAYPNDTEISIQIGTYDPETVEPGTYIIRLKAWSRWFSAEKLITLDVY